jgi:hypothetical protein
MYWVIYMANLKIYSTISNVAVILQKLIISSWEITSIEDIIALQPYVYFWLLKLSFLKISFFYVETTNANQSIKFMDFMIRAKECTLSSFGNNLQTCLTLFQFQLLSTIRYYVCMEVYLPNF